jgi:TPR repeat protein
MVPAVQFRMSSPSSLPNRCHKGAQLLAQSGGVPQDYVLAHKWLNLAAADDLLSGTERTQIVRLRENIAKKMTPDQIAEAQRVVREECGSV